MKKITNRFCMVTLRRVSHLLFSLLIVCCLGCSLLPIPLPGKLGKAAEDESLRKQVEADNFPTAKQLGLRSNNCTL